MPRCLNAVEHHEVTSVLGFLIGQEVVPRSNDMGRPVVEIALTERPTSRLQAQMLANWFGNQVACLADSGMRLPCNAKAPNHPLDNIIHAHPPA